MYFTKNFKIVSQIFDTKIGTKMIIYSKNQIEKIFLIFITNFKI